MSAVGEEDWKLEGICNSDPELWFSEDEHEIEKAKDTCLDCPVMQKCLIYALERDEKYGIWGGEDRAGRMKIKRDRIRK